MATRLAPLPAWPSGAPRLEWAQSDRPRREWQAWAQVRAEVFMPRGHAGEAGHRRGARGDVPTPGRLAD